MKRLLLSLAVFLFVSSAFAQNSNLIIFDEDGEKFTLWLNGVKKNQSPKSNVKIESLSADFYKVKIAFNNKALKSFTKSLWFEEQGKEYTYRIHQKNNGKLTLRPVSMVDIPENAHPVEEEIEDNKYEAPESTPQTTTGKTTVTHHETHTVKSDRPTGESSSVNLKMKVNDSGMDVSVDDGQERADVNVDFEIDGETTHTSTTTTTSSTTTSTSTGVNTDVNEDLRQNTESGGAERISGNCHASVNDNEFSDIVESIKSKTFEDTKISTAKQIAKNECLDSEQIKEIMQVFTYEESRLDFAKYAYDYVYNPNKYYKVNDAFEYEMSIEELQEFLESKN